MTAHPFAYFVAFLVPLGICGSWLLYRAIALGRESRKLADQYKPKIHKADYVKVAARKFEYFKLICAACGVSWAMFFAIALAAYFGGSNGAS